MKRRVDNRQCFCTWILTVSTVRLTIKAKILSITWRNIPMPDQLTDEALCERGLAVIEHELGPVPALRFLSLISRQPFDYQRWRQQHFDGMSLAEILAQSQSAPR